MVGAEGPELVREHTTLSEVEFVDLSDGDFFFVGWTIDSESVLTHTRTLRHRSLNKRDTVHCLKIHMK